MMVSSVYVTNLLLLLTFSTVTNAFTVVPPTQKNVVINPSLVKKTASSSSSLASSPFDSVTNFFDNIFKENEAEVKEVLPPVVIDPSFKLAGIFLVGGLALDLIPYIQLTLGPFVTLLGVLFLVQTFRLRFFFDENDFELRVGDELDQGGENIVVGGENRWAYDSFVNWKFFPEGWVDQPQGPILAYFKETQTPEDKWEEGPGKSANSEEAMERGAVPGQVHFFPVLCDAKQLEAEFIKRGCAKLE